MTQKTDLSLSTNSVFLFKRNVTYPTVMAFPTQL